MRAFLIAFALVLVVRGAAAAPTPAPVRAEIDALLATLQSSGCWFNRNGTWYSATVAKEHLLSKLGNVEKMTTIDSTEQFIARVAEVVDDANAVDT